MAEQKVLFSMTNVKKYFPLKKSKLFQREKLYVKANDGVDLTIYEGETFGLVGESGCGKSTFGRVLLQLHSQTDGRTMYYGRERGEIAPQYVKKTLQHINKLLAKQKKLDAERNEINRQYDALTDEKARWAMEDRRREANKRADDLFVDIAKIIGGFIVCDQLDEIAKAFLAEHDASIQNFRTKEAMDQIVKEIDVLEQAKPSAKRDKRIGALSAKLAMEKQRAEENQKALAAASAHIEALRQKHQNTPDFQKYEAYLDQGIDLSKLTAEEMRMLRKDAQLIFQDPYSSLNPRMTVAQLIGEGMLAHKIFHSNSSKMQDSVLQIMDHCGLAPYMMHRYPHQFSGGQRQRIGIARSLAVSPKFIVCDEAVSALDVSIQSQILNLLLDLKDQENLTYLFISHDLSVIKYISDRIGVMYLGNMVELATSQELFENPLHPYTEALLLAIPTTDVDAPKDMEPIQGDIPSPIRPPSGCKFHTRCKYCMEICKQVTPLFQEINPGHFVACHLRGTER